MVFQKETVTEIMVFYKDTKVMVCSPVGDTDYFDIFTGVFQGDTLATFLFIICLDNVQRTNVNRSNERKRSHTKR